MYLHDSLLHFYQESYWVQSLDDESIERNPKQKEGTESHRENTLHEILQVQECKSIGSCESKGGTKMKRGLEVVGK